MINQIKSNKILQKCIFLYISNNLNLPCLRMGVEARMRRRFNGLHNISRTSEYIQRKAFSNSSSINNADDDSICPVLIVGAGPVGLSLSLLLTKLGSYLLPKTFFIQLLGIQIIYLLFDLVPKKNKYIF